MGYTFVKGEEYKAKEYTISEAEFAKYADALNPTVFASKCVLSVDPVDYLLMSNGNSWSSCYCINSSWNGENYGGQYSCGTWSYMTDGVTMILYTVSKDVWNNYAEVPKVNRQLIMYDNAGYMTNSRLYPQSNDSTNAKAVYDSIRNCSQKMIAETFGLPNFWLKRDGTEFSISYDFAGYNDLSYFNDKIVSSENKTANEASYTDKETKKVVKIAAKKREKSVGGKALCPCCGDELDERYICNSCTEDEYVICEDCGSRINIRGGDCYLEYNGEYYCEDCYCICNRCGEIVPARETQEVHSNHWETWCDSCANEEAFYCEYHECYEDESYYTEASDIETSQGYLVTWCTEALEQDGGWYCEKCETYHTGDCKYHLDSNGNTICDDCWEGNDNEEA